MATTASITQRPIRVALFDSIPEADEAVAELLAAGFSKDQITVICSEAAIQRHFKEFEHQDSAGAHTAAAGLTGGAIGAVLGGLAALAGAATLGGAVLLVAGGIGIWGGGVVGGLVGAMMTRGMERELANYYDQAVTQGKILVAADEPDPAHQAMLQKAAAILAQHAPRPCRFVKARRLWRGRVWRLPEAYLGLMPLSGRLL